MMFSKARYSTIFLLFLASIFYSQTPPYFHYSSSDGLASSTVFHMVQDKKGYLWFGTLNGLSRFDGTRFINYKAKDGLNSNSITYIVEGEDNTLYLSNFERGINTIKDGKIENFRQVANFHFILVNFYPYRAARANFHIQIIKN